MPTIKQKKAFKAVGENGGNISKAMETAGYAKSITHATEKLTKSKGWQELMNQHLPDKLLAKVHNEGLGATTGKDKEPDYSVRHKYLETAYKVKGYYNENPGATPPTMNMYNFFFSPDLRKKVEVVEAEIKNALLQDAAEN